MPVGFTGFVNKINYKKLENMKKIFLRVVVFVVILVLVFTPYLLVVDFKKFSPLVFLIWVVSIAYYIMMKRAERYKTQNREEEPGEDDVSRETD